MAKRWEPKFLSVLEETANVSSAAEAAGISRTIVYRERAENEDFAAKWDKALDVGVSTLEDEAIRRARDGVLEPVYWRGEEVGAVRKYSDTLLIFLLKSHKPERYNPPQRQEVSGKDGGDVAIRVVYENRPAHGVTVEDDSE